jgi:DNA polymerase/3'-5' exonuclease PolX
VEWPRALDHAKDVRLLLQPCCERVEIAGSLRRLRAEVNDIEFVAQPKMQPFDMLNARLADMVAHHWLYPGPASKNMKRPPMGPRYYRLAIPIGGTEDRLQLDIFAVLPPADFGVIFTIRTGSAEFSHWLVTEALRKGMKVQDGQLFRIHRDEQPWRFEKIPCPEEPDFFRALGIEYVHPSSRQQPATMSTGTGE